MGKVALFLVLILLLSGSVWPYYDTSPVFSPDGLSVAFVRYETPDSAPLIVTSPIAVPGYRVLTSGIAPRYNPDGMLILYLVESVDKPLPDAWQKLGIGKTYTDIWVAQLDTGEIRQITRQGGASAVWSADGGEIAYINTFGTLCRIPLDGVMKKITTRIPCCKCLTWLPDWQSFAATRTVKGKMARYAFSPPSRTPVRISIEHVVPLGALAPKLTESGAKMAYLLRNQLPQDTGTAAGLELWAAWRGGRRKVADIPLAQPLTPADLEMLSLAWSDDGRLVAAACGGRVFVVELATGAVTCISDAPPAAFASPEASEPEASETPETPQTPETPLTPGAPADSDQIDVETD